MDGSVSLRLIVHCFLLSVVFDAYEKMTELSIEDSIKNELSGDFERLMLAVGKNSSKSLLLGHHGKWQVVSLTISPWFLHSPVHKERSHVLCEAPLQVNEGKRATQSGSKMCVYRYLP